MFTAILLAFRQLPQREMRRPLFLTMLWSVIIFAVLWTGIGWFIAHGFTENAWINGTLSFLGVLAAPIVTWLLFPSLAITVLGFYSEAIIRAVERRHYSYLRPPASTRWLVMAHAGLRLALTSLVVNVLVLPLYLLVPGINLILFLVLNGYLLGREYFNTVALRRMEAATALQLWRRYRIEFIVAGMVIAGLFLIPLLNLVAPMVGIAAAVHLVERLRQSQAAEATG
jgi:CysZ protein